MGREENKKTAHFLSCFFVWWEVVDSNHGSKKQQIYSLSPLATRETSPMKLRVELVMGLEPATY